MSASLVGSEMCIRDSPHTARTTGALPKCTHVVAVMPLAGQQAASHVGSPWRPFDDPWMDPL
eukprot:10565602-Alexandrium_andersonii.AAC.1